MADLSIKGQTFTTHPYDERTLVQITAWILVFLALGMEVFHQSWKTLVIVAGVILLASTAMAVRLESVNLVGFLKKTGIWFGLIVIVLVVELGVHAHWDLDTVTSRQITTATVLVMVGDLIAEARDHISERVTRHQHNDGIRASINTIHQMIARVRHWSHRLRRRCMP
ncbi:hypothetical protein AB0A70_05640 [Streptomyces morookaense]|uniref:hypothetical protein n=1 Tax=Streptomyces morookaense TaxID=1970 RepID=UPI0033C0FA23